MDHLDTPKASLVPSSQCSLEDVEQHVHPLQEWGAKCSKVPPSCNIFLNEYWEGGSEGVLTNTLRYRSALMKQVTNQELVPAVTNVVGQGGQHCGIGISLGTNGVVVPIGCISQSIFCCILQIFVFADCCSPFMECRNTLPLVF